jgi:hypothetical protein
MVLVPLLSYSQKAPSLLHLCLATASLLAMTGQMTFYEFIKIELLQLQDYLEIMIAGLLGDGKKY